MYKFEKEQGIRITSDELPLHCPLPHQAIWNQHPRVYLPIADTKHEKCPYCGLEYLLVD